MDILDELYESDIKFYVTKKTVERYLRKLHTVSVTHADRHWPSVISSKV